MSERVALDLFCGSSKAPGMIGVDVRDLPEVDIVYDLEQGIPFADNSVDHIRAHHGPEHVSDILGFMRECHRVLKPGGMLRIHVPSTDGRGAWDNPTHRSYWNINTFITWTDPKHRSDYITAGARFDVVYLKNKHEGRRRVTVVALLQKPQSHGGTEKT